VDLLEDTVDVNAVGLLAGLSALFVSGRLLGALDSLLS
jgi:hypothetical protein